MTNLVTKQVRQERPKVSLASPDWDDWNEDKQNEAEELPFKTLTREQAQALQVKHPPISVWRVVGIQALVGAVIAVLAYLLTGQGKTAQSALWGAAAVVFPNALMAWGMTGLFRGMPAAAVLGFMFWELIKIMTAVAILAVAAVWVSDLNWLAMLAGLVGCLKVNWLALLWQGRTSQVK
ncbi:ATP synthase subunit I [Roseateles oligotrophus]|uniref:ATP synthase subunit I n=1 Tax=Roseateles oligotrophus TaxID=1769250 RepID=A0ABT2YDF3_9BURK|nr:ATP synthase subunit I [Roseateles oligotrophus]MCV2368059.1 ATP synthase subunit I [Roseateles oligotrophus]